VALISLTVLSTALALVGLIFLVSDRLSKTVVKRIYPKEHWFQDGMSMEVMKVSLSLICSIAAGGILYFFANRVLFNFAYYPVTTVALISLIVMSASIALVGLIFLVSHRGLGGGYIQPGDSKGLEQLHGANGFFEKHFFKFHYGNFCFFQVCGLFHPLQGFL
jgi:preprotein translocase subunit SecG